MIGTIVFVVAFVAVGLTVVLLAMRSGRPPAGSRPETRGQRRAWGVGIGLVIAVLGVAVPLLVLVFNSDSQAERGPSGLKLTAAQARGRELFVKTCATCHTLRATSSVGRVGPNLDDLTAVQGASGAAFVLNAIENGRARGAGMMPAGLLVGNDAKDVAEFVSAVSGR